MIITKEEKKKDAVKVCHYMITGQQEKCLIWQVLNLEKIVINNLT